MFKTIFVLFYVRHMMARHGFTMVVVYFDDFLVIGKSLSECQTAYNVNSFCLLVSILALPRTEEGGATVSVSQISWCSVRHHLS